VNGLVDVGLSNAVAACVLAVVACLVGRVSRRPAVVHAAWLVVILRLVTPPLFWVPVWPAPGRVDAPVAAAVVAVAEVGSAIEVAEPIEAIDAALSTGEWEAAESAGEGVAVAEDVVAAAPPKFARVASAWSWPTWDWRVWVAGVWVAGSLAWVGIAARRVARLRRALADADGAPEELAERVRELAFELGLRRAPEARMVEGRLGPFVWALGRRAVLVVPRELWKRLDEDQRTTLLLHELAHLRRGDHWVRLLELLATGVYWWHPVLWLARARLHAAEEECCDAWVVWARPKGAEVYARALVEAVEFLSGVKAGGAAVPVGASGLGRLRHVSRRIVMIMRGDVARGMSPTGIALVVGLAALLPWLPTRASGGGQAAEQEPAAAVSGAEAGGDSGSVSAPQVAGEGESGESAGPAPLGGLGQSPKILEDLQMEAEILETQVQVKAAMVKKAEAQRQMANATLSRLTRIKGLRSSAVADEEMEKAEAAVGVADADVEIAKGELAEVELRRKYSRQDLERMSAALRRDDRFDARAKAEWEKAQREWQVMAERRLAAVGDSFYATITETEALKRVGIALHNYHDVHRRFPGPAILSADGRPLLSWRVAILPFLEGRAGEALYREFKLDEPWDSEHNKRLLERMPRDFALGPSDAQTTRLTAVVGPETMWGKPEGTPLSGMRDGTTWTVAVVVADEGVEWTKPEDIPFDRESPAFERLVQNGCLVVRADGRVSRLQTADPRAFMGMFTVNGGEAIIPEWVSDSAPRPLATESRRGASSSIPASRATSRDLTIGEVVNGLKQIGLALHNHGSAHTGRFPGPAILGKDGKPLLSWRVAILPYLEAGDLYNEFKLDEPWDSEHNKRLISRIPKVYALGQKDPGKTRFQAVVGPETMWGKPEGVGFSEIPDGTSNTVAVVFADEGVIWTKPEDVAFGGDNAALVQLFSGGACALLGDGSVRNIGPFNPSLIGAIFTRAGNEVIEWDRYGPAQATTRVADNPRRPETQEVRPVSIEQLAMRRLEREAEALRAENRALMSVVEAMRARDRQPLAASEQIDLAILAKLLERAGGDEESLVRTAVKLLLKREASEQEVADGLERIKAAEDRGAALEALLRAISVQQARAGRRR
jgi:beta-lactamase regulating signal transducer with metallopeptidase domain